MPSTLRCAAVAFAVLLSLFVGSPAQAADPGVVSLGGPNWHIAAQADVAATGPQIAAAGFDANRWLRADVPGTVFGSYVKAGVEKEPTYGDNIYRVDRKKYDRDFWYRTEFAVPPSYGGGKIWLNFDGVNRDADIYLNGKSVGSLHGFLQRGRFDVTALLHVGGRNTLAVLDHVPVRGNRSENYFSPTFICSAGWDWMPYVPGLETGIYKDVCLTRTGPVSVVDPWIRTVSESPESAELALQTTVENTSAASVDGVLSGVIEPGHLSFSEPVRLAAGEARNISLDSKSVPALRVANPRLWWPNGYGDPNLYNCALSFRVGGQVSDRNSVTFGIRQYSYDTEGGVLRFRVNGVRVFPKGGSWGMAEFMLRCNAKDYDSKVRFHKEMHMNMIRNWMGMTPDEAFYAACDRYGIMVWDEFWLNSSGGLPSDVNVFRANVIEKIKTFRNHACIALWCGMNEGDPPAPLNDWLREDIQTFDGGDRRYQPNSHAGDLSGSGPWSNFDPRQYFVGVPGFGGDGKPFGMRSEIGTATFTSFDSFKKFMPPADWWPRTPMWNTHYFGPNAFNAGPGGYNFAIRERYGVPGNIQDYCEKAQLLNLETMKALYEGWLDHSDQDAAGVLIWMSQSAYPSFVWQTYDYYYDCTAAYWAARTACEPIHIYWNENDDRIRVVNTGGQAMTDLTAEATLFNMSGSLHQGQTVKLNSAPGTITDCFTLTFTPGLSPTHFIRLRLRDHTRRVVSENFYWHGRERLDYRALEDMPTVSLKSTMKLSRDGDQDVVTAVITNPVAMPRTVALAVRPKLVRGDTGAQVLPVFASDGYFALLPGESRTVVMRYDHGLAGPSAPKLVVECWNNRDRSKIEVKTDNLAFEKPVTASSVDHYADGPDAVDDGDTLTRWSSAWSSDPQWIMIDLGTSQAIDRVKLTWETAYAKSYAIQVSDDGEHWTDIYHTTEGNGKVEDLSKFHGQGRYIRLYATERATQYGYSLYEFEVYGPPGH